MIGATMNGNSTNPDPNRPKPAQAVPRIDFSRPLLPITGAALATALGLIAVVILGHLKFGIPDQISNLLVACGVALILAAFGGQAIVTFGNYAMAGVAAIAVVLFGTLNWLDSNNKAAINENLRLLKNSYLRGHITGLPIDRYVVHLSIENYVAGVHLSGFKRFDFVIFKNELDKSNAANLEIADKNDPDHEISLRIPKECLADFLGQDEIMALAYDATKKELLEEKSKGKEAVISAFDHESDIVPCEQKSAANEATEPRSFNSMSWFSSAFAADTIPTDTATRAEIDQAMTEIESSDTDVRRGARNLLSRVQPEDVSYVLAQLRQKLSTNSSIYRTKLGVSIALTELLRRDKSLRDKMHLETADFQTLLDFAGSDDRNLRIYSGEFLYDLESPDVARLALPLASTTTNDDARYNWLFVSQGGWPGLSDEQKKQLSPALQDLRTSTALLPRTTDLLAKFE